MKITREQYLDEQIRVARSGLSTAAQTPAAGVRTLITGSSITIPPPGLRVGHVFNWKFNITKTAAGIAASTFDISFWPTPAADPKDPPTDTARVSFTKPAGTAAADEGWVEITAIVRSIGATGVMVGTFRMTHDLENTGHATTPCVVKNTVSAAFDTTPITRVSLYITPGAADVITIQEVVAEAR